MGGSSSGVSTRIWTVPNVLSMLRLLLVPVFLVLVVAGEYVAALAVLVAASLTDLLDGYLARRFDQVTRLGQLLDPAADRLDALTRRRAAHKKTPARAGAWLLANSVLGPASRTPRGVPRSFARPRRRRASSWG